MKQEQEDIDLAFQEAYQKASTTSKRFPPDIMLKFYAYYKQATENTGTYPPSGERDVKNAFKLNALLQIKGLSPTEAKKKYIDLVQKYIDDKN